MSVSFLFTRRRLIALSLMTAVLPAPLFAAQDAAVESAAKTLAASPVAVAGMPDYDGRLTVTVRCPEAVEAAKTLAVTGAGGERLAFSARATSKDMLRLDVRIRSKDTSFRVTAPGLDSTVVTPPMFFCTPEGITPDADTVFPIRLRFTQRLDASQKPPKVTVTPAVPGLLTHVDGNALVLTGAFPARTTLRVRFDSDVLAADGWIFKAGETVAVDVGGRSASAGFAFESGVLAPGGSLGVPLKVCNLSKVTVRVATLSPENLVAALHSRSMRDTLLETAAEKEIAVKAAPDEVREMLFDVRTSADKPGASVCGVRLLTVSWPYGSGDYDWDTSTSSFVNVTDLALTPLLDDDGRGLTVWVTGISGAKPVPGVEVVVRSAQNRVLARGLSDASGLVKLTVPGERGATPAWVVTATKGDDFSYVRLTDARRGYYEGEVAASTGITALLYADRGVHRGGETVRMAALARTATGGALPEGPMEFRLKRPDGRLFASVKAKGEAGGFYFADFTLPADVPYGRYTAQFLTPGSEEPLAVAEVPVSAFEPLRLKSGIELPASRVEAESSGRRVSLYSGDAPRFVLKSKYRFGSPAAGLKSFAAFRVEPAAVTFAAFSGFTFGYAAEDESRLVQAQAQPLDAAGVRELIPCASPSPGLWTLRCTANVVEPGGRTDTAFARAVWMNATTVAGLAPDEDGGPAVAKPFRLRVALADAEGKPASAAPVRIIAERLIENWTLQRQREGMVWRRTTERVPAGEVSLPASAFKAGIAPAEFTFAAPGEHRLTATTGDGVRTEIPVWVAGAGERAPGAAPHLVTLRPQKEAAEPGETVRVVVEAPFSGTALLTLESDRVLESRVVTLTGDKDALDVRLPENARGSVWVSLREIRPLDAKQPSWKPVEATGSVMIKVAHADRKLVCAIDAPAKAAPGEKTRVVVRVSGNNGKPVAVHCWAVDTGILDITGFKTPDPFDRFLGAKADGVKAATTYDDLLPDFARTLERIGAGDGTSVFRGNGMKNRKPVAVVWSGVTLTGADGVLSRDLVMPDHNGELRWMAVAAQDDRYGAAESVSRLSRPVTLEVSSPAFLAPGDLLRVPVALFNNTGAPATLSLATEVSGVAVETGLPASVTLPADGSPWRGVLTVRAGDAVGDASVVVRASGTFSGNTVVEKLPLNIRHALPVRTETRIAELKAGDFATLTSLVPAFAPGARCTVSVSDGAAVVAAPLYAALIDYPYGCVEQTSSRIVALAAAGESFGLPGAGSGEAVKARVDALIRNGLDRLALNLRADGGLAYWPESPASDPDGSRIAGEAFIAAAAHGVKPDEAFVKALSGYLRRRLYLPETPVAMQTRLCATLAGLGAEESNRMRYLTENAGNLDGESAAWLALAWSRSGDRATAAAVLKSAESYLAPELELARTTRFGGTAVRNATILAALDATEPSSLRAGVYAATLARMAAEPLNTYEQGAVLGALARHSRLAGGASAPASVAFDDGLAPLKTDRGLVWRHFDATRSRKLTNTGKGNAFVVVSTTGIAAGEGAVPVSAGLSVRREFLDGVTGDPVDITKGVRVGDSLLVRLHLDTETALGSVPDVVISDLFPACFEPDGTQVEPVRTENNDRSRVSRSEMREDRALAFLTAQQAMTFEYRVRVTAAGRFVLPPSQAMSMYRPDIRAVGAAGEITVTE